MKELVKEWIKAAYLLALRVLPISARKTAKVLYYATFAGNDAGVIEALHARYGQDFVVFATPKAKAQLSALRAAGVHVELLGRSRLFTQNLISYLKSARVVVVDDYLPELSLVAHPRVIMLWHANGAIKRFGWGNPATGRRPAGDRRRFTTVYGKYTDILTGSDRMGDIFVESWRVSPDVIRPLGFVRSDLLVDQHPTQAPAVPVLYAPTYRRNPRAMRAVLAQAFAAFAKLDVPVLVKLHPAVTDAVVPALPANVTLVATPLEDLYGRTATLVTDYSSAAFDYVLCRDRPHVVFFTPDLADYAQRPGLQADFAAGALGPLVQDGAGLVAALNQPPDPAVEAALAAWNQYNDGHAGARLLALVADSF
ncbi:CDP-glycerol glycerophosphotransferase family protein [Lacticaseibacillus kribbianus]|uniref:CDP-glycerol glycerophosphotransferase family protein n=1 Tax=Lacticaseibacillus kribbianus TaxID=2926292 RepID=UPI001CD35AAA|nr:CDP-glycerol glycerophosphotransferase family protein [Lacticaseibacillus kribbianus]